MSPSASDADRRLFERLVHETRDDLLAYALRRSASPEDAADVLSETYLIAWRKLEKIPPGEQARLWLFGVARNVIRQGVDRRRSRDALVERIAREVRAATHVDRRSSTTAPAPLCRQRMASCRSSMSGRVRRRSMSS